MTELPRALLIPNRGEIARRLVRTAQRLGMRAVVAHSDVDESLPAVREADQAVCLGPAAPAASYLSVENILDAARTTDCDSVHPGYGFLSENADFAQRVEDAGLTWVGPSAAVIRNMGDKILARRLAADAGVPVSTGKGDALTDADSAVQEAEDLGYPVMLKASAGGGGIGMVRASTQDELRTAFDSTRSAAERAFGSSAVFLERFISTARHVEVQILGLNDGTVISLGERDCSVQRRHQKVAEESPAPNLNPVLRDQLSAAAVSMGESIDYRGAGTVEFLVDKQTEDFVFLEMNTRLQVEHPVTELVHGVDLVAEQLRIAGGGHVSERARQPTSTGTALEFRVYAEDPVRFFPSPGTIDEWCEPQGEGVRVDAGYEKGNVVTPYYDPLLAKLCVWGRDREEALQRAEAALTDFKVSGLQTNLEFLRRLVVDAGYRVGDYDTDIVKNVQARQSRGGAR